MERSDKALLAAFLVAAGLGTLGHCLLVNDGAVFVAASWLGDAWGLYFRQVASRAVSTYLEFGPAQLVLRMAPLSASAFDRLAHILYFAAPLALWFCLRAIEPHRVFSRLYLAVVLALLYFPSEGIVAIGLWLIWLALVADPRRGPGQITAATAILGGALVFTHPAVAVMTLLYAVVGAGLGAVGRPVPRRSLYAASGLFAILLAGNLMVSRLLPPTNPLIIAALASGRLAYLDPVGLVAEIGRFPAIAVLWLLLIGPGLFGRFGPGSLVVLAIVGLWFAAAGTNLLTYLAVRHTALYVLAVAVTLALTAPDQWLRNAERGFMLYAAIAATAAASYAADLLLFERYVDERSMPGFVNVETMTPERWPEPVLKTSLAHMLFKWSAGPDYVRDVVVPTYDWYRLTLGFYSYFRSDRESVLFHPTGRPGDWLPFECPDIDVALAAARDATDRAFLAFLRANLCVPSGR
ncbi:MAG: hypothetical protein JSS04_20180 [Proteobacteria bacterium]|nr:hypothetical protein [Pseudomonadota bacterium]